MKLTDNSSFPFGTHKGKKMGNVPSSYLLWLREQEWIKEWPRVLEYINDNLDVLAAEAKLEKAQYNQRYRRR